MKSDDCKQIHAKLCLVGERCNRIDTELAVEWEKEKGLRALGAACVHHFFADIAGLLTEVQMMVDAEMQQNEKG